MILWGLLFILGGGGGVVRFLLWLFVSRRSYCRSLNVSAKARAVPGLHRDALQDDHQSTEAARQKRPNGRPHVDGMTELDEGFCFFGFGLIGFRCVYGTCQKLRRMNWMAQKRASQVL